MDASKTCIAKRALAVLAAALIALTAMLGTANVAFADDTCDHTYSDWQVSKLATSTERGTATRTCAKCSATETTSTITPATVKRISGSNRYSTAAAISQEYTDESSGVIVTTGENFPDALTATGLNGCTGYPIILTKSTELSSEAAAEIERLGASEIYIVGGTSAVSANVEKQLKKYGTVKRLSGNTRYETALAVYDEGVELDYWGSWAIIATGANYPDALSISSFASGYGEPIFLVNPKTGLDDATKQALLNGGFRHVVIVGGESAVSKDTEKWLRENMGIEDEDNFVRLGGDNRYDTSLAIAEYFEGDRLEADCSCIATGTNFPDALAGGVLAGDNDGFVLLADPDHLQALSIIEDNADDVNRIYILGGERAVLNTLKYEVEDMLGIMLDDSIDFTDAKATLLGGPYKYSGSPVKPKVSVTFNGVTLTEGTDYTVAYSNNNGENTGTITITGTGLFVGTITKNFHLGNVVASGDSGYDTTWTYYDTGLLAISGSFVMENYGKSDTVPWSEYANSITSVSIDNGVINAGRYAFSDLPNLQTVELAASVTAVEDYSFYNCASLTTVTCAPGSRLSNIVDYAFYDCKNLASINLPDGLETIGKSAFTGCSSLKSIAIPASVSNIKENAFYNCKGLESLTFAENISLDEISAYAFCGCEKLTSIDIPASVESLESNAFASCTGLESIYIPSSIEVIGTHVFGNCTNLSSVTFYPDSKLETIGLAAFEGCTSLTSISVPSKVTSIQKEAFKDCTSLTTASVPTAASVDSSAFPSGCAVTRY